NIRVRSIVGRFLEHTRVYYFFNNGKDEIYAGSADMMERNLLHRVETAFPIENNKLKERMKNELEVYMQDNCQAWDLQPDGSYVRAQPGKNADIIKAQSLLLETLAASSSGVITDAETTSTALADSDVPAVNGVGRPVVRRYATACITRS